MHSSPHIRTNSRDALLFALALVVLYAVLMVAKIALWRGNVLMNDWSFYNNSFWNTNFRDLWLFSHDRFVQFGYKSYLNEHFAPLLLVVAALYHVVPQPELMLLMLMGASPVLAAVFIRVAAIEVLGDRTLAGMIALSYALSPGILWPTMSMAYGFQPDGMLAPLAAMLGWALAARRTGVYFVVLAMMLAVKENVPAYGAILGAGLVLFTDRKRQGVITVVVSLAVFAFAAKGIPVITGVENRNVGRVWSFIDDVIHLRPTLDYTATELAVFVGYSLAFLPALFVWPFLAMLGPDALLIGQVSYAKTVTWHVMLPVTVLGVASVFGSAVFLKTRHWPAGLDGRFSRQHLLQLYWRAVLAVSVIAAAATIWLAYARYIAIASPVDRVALARAIASVPPDAGVATTSDIEQYLVRRRVMSSRPGVLNEAPDAFTYAVVNRGALAPNRRGGILNGVDRQDACIVAAAEQVARSGGQVMDEGGILVVRFARMPKLDCRD